MQIAFLAPEQIANYAFIIFIFSFAKWLQKSQNQGNTKVPIIGKIFVATLLLPLNLTLHIL